jgi:hypothetical protein
MALLDQIDEFQATMVKVMELVEEGKALAAQLPDVSASELPAKVKTVYDVCSDGISLLRNALEQTEDIQRSLGG